MPRASNTSNMHLIRTIVNEEVFLQEILYILKKRKSQSYTEIKKSYTERKIIPLCVTSF